MTNLVVNQIVTLLVQIIFSIAGLGVTYAIGIGALYLNKKRQALIEQIGVDKYNSGFTIAKGIYFQIEQLFKFIPAAGKLKAEQFNKLLLAKVPGLTQDEIDHFRESIVGEINSQVKKNNLLAPAYDALKDELDVKYTSDNIFSLDVLPE